MGAFDTHRSRLFIRMAEVGCTTSRPERKFDDRTTRRSDHTQRLSDGRTTDYGCGISTFVRDGEQILQHGGGNAGFVAASMMFPRTRSAIVVLSNRDDTNPWELVKEISALLGKEHQPPPLSIAGTTCGASRQGDLRRPRIGEGR